MKTIIYKVFWDFDLDTDDLFAIILDPDTQHANKQAAKYDLYQIKITIDCVIYNQSYIVQLVTVEEAARRQDKIDEDR